jgi:hypothetical protein
VDKLLINHRPFEFSNRSFFPNKTKKKVRRLFFQPLFMGLTTNLNV